MTGLGVPARLYLKTTSGGGGVAIENPHYTRKYFGRGLERSPWPHDIPVPKPADEFRIFLLGESAALGDPIPEFGMARMLEALLHEEIPGKRIFIVF